MERTRGILRLRTILGNTMLLVFLFCFLQSSIARPTEEPTKFTLSTQEGNSQSTASQPLLDRGKTLVAEAQNNVPSVIAAKMDILNQGLRSFGAIQTAPQSNISPRDMARLENETAQGFLEKPFSKSAGLGLGNFFNPTPLVDRIQEQEKYGNSGDKFIGIGRAIVGGFEGLSNFLNTIVDLPRNAIKQKSEGLTGTLNQIGARLIGLE